MTERPYFIKPFQVPLGVQKKLKDKLHVTWNKCTRFCLKLKCREHISNEGFERLNWLPINQMFKECNNSAIFKFLYFKYKLGHYYLIDLSSPNLCSIGEFYYALPIIKILFLFMTYSCIFFFLLHSDSWTWMKTRLFTCFVLSLPCCFFFLTNIANNINSVYFLCLFGFFVLWRNKTTYFLMTRIYAELTASYWQLLSHFMSATCIFPFFLISAKIGCREWFLNIT